MKKRIFDLVCALLLLTVLAPLIAVVALLILVVDGRPVFFRQERMKTPAEPFMLFKFRTMVEDADDQGVSGGDKAHRITRLGEWLRRHRIDEIPQLLNILRGEMSFVGPRPPLRRYVEMFPDLYERVLSAPPGITGLATLVYFRHEEALLENCKTPEETEEVYVRRCVPSKAWLDLIYAKNRSLCFDVQLMLATVFRRMPLHARQLRRVRSET